MTTRTPSPPRSYHRQARTSHSPAHLTPSGEGNLGGRPSGRAEFPCLSSANPLTSPPLPEVGSEVAGRFLDRLEAHPHFTARSRWVRPTFQDGTLRLSGCLPTFYLKQIVQTIAHRTPGVRRVLNQIEVRDCLQGDGAVESWQLDVADA